MSFALELGMSPVHQRQFSLSAVPEQALMSLNRQGFPQKTACKSNMARRVLPYGKRVSVSFSLHLALPSEHSAR
jgi:hypothetical protein